MKKSILFATVLTLILCLTGSAMASVYTFRPTPQDMFDLDHRWYYSWGLEWDHPGEEITEVTLTFKNIQDYVVEDSDTLFMHLFDDAPLGVIPEWDAPDTGDAWDGVGTYIGSWSDPLGYPNPAVDVVINFSDLGLVDDFATFAADGVVGFGFDPDCHYWNDYIELTVTTAVPEAGTLGLLILGFGLLGGGRYIRKRRK